MTEHPSLEELAALARGALPPERARTIFRHLLQPCERCRMELASHAALEFDPQLTVEEDAAYDAVLDRTSLAALQYERRFRRRKAEAKKLEQILSSGGLEVVHKLPRKLDEVALFDALLARSWSLRHQDAGLMEQFAWLALQQVDRIDPRIHGIKPVFDLRCRAWAELGNAYRIGDKLDLASWALCRAREVFELGTVDPSLEIRIVELEATLATDKRQFKIANLKLSKVFQFYWSHGDEHLAGRALILLGLYTGYAGEPEEGIRLLQKGLSLVNVDLDRGLVYAAIHNQLLFLIDTGNFRQAKRFRLEHSRELSSASGRINEVKLRSLEGRIDAGLGNHERAADIFLEVRSEFERMGRGYDASLASLDLAAALLAQKKLLEAREVAFEAAKTFVSLGIDREALAAVVLLREIFEMGRATVGLVQDVAAFLRRAEFDPDARFDPAEL